MNENTILNYSVVATVFAFKKKDLLPNLLKMGSRYDYR